MAREHGFTEVLQADAAVQDGVPARLRWTSRMNGVDEWRPFLRGIVRTGGDIVDVARAIRAFGGDGQYIQAAAALRQEFGLAISEALTVVGWAEGTVDDESSLVRLRAEVRTPLR